MTFERKIILGVEDIKAISLECKHCHVRLTYSTDEIDKVPEVCPRCNTRWLPTIHIPGDQVKKIPAVSFIEAIRNIRRQTQDEQVIGIPFGFKVLLEFEDPRP
jgi:hypothetical protein